MSKPTLKAAFLGEACRDFVIEAAPLFFLLHFHEFAVTPQVELTGSGHLFQVLLGVCLGGGGFIFVQQNLGVCIFDTVL